PKVTVGGFASVVRPIRLFTAAVLTGSARLIHRARVRLVLFLSRRSRAHPRFSGRRWDGHVTGAPSVARCRRNRGGAADRAFTALRGNGADIGSLGCITHGISFRYGILALVV